VTYVTGHPLFGLSLIAKIERCGAGLRAYRRL
jgi:hypothetical protein